MRIANINLVERRRKFAMCAAIGAALGAGSRGLAVTETPLGITGWTVNEIYSGTQTTVGFDAKNDWVFYTNTAPSCPANSGLPTANNGTFVNQLNAGTTFQFQPFTSNNALELNTDSTAMYGPLGSVSNAQVTTGTLNLSSPEEYTNLAFLNADANGNSTITYTLNFVGGTTATGTFAGLDWFNNTGVALNNIGRVFAPNESFTSFGTMFQSSIYQAGTNPQLYETDISVPVADQTLQLQSVTFSMAASGASQWSILGISGANPIYTYTGTDSTSPASFDNASLNFQQTGTAAAFSNGSIALFDDTAAGSHTVSVAAGGVSPAQVQFQNSTTPYTINGPGSITGAGGLSVAGGGVVTLNNVNTYTGNTTVSSGTLNLNPGASIASAKIIVSSGGSFEVSGTAGTGNSVTITGPGMTSTYANPIPNGPTGALRGGDGVTSTWTGNVVVSGPSYIASGADGTLILTGSISGSGPVTFTGNTNDNAGATIVLSPSAGNANTYTGETQLLPDVNVNVTNGTLLQLGADNGVSINSGLNIITGSLPELVTFDLNGHNQSVQYLKGSAQTGYVITNNGSAPSTLTVTSGLSGGSPSVLGTAIQGNIAVVMNDPTGLGNQILNGSNTYTGGTTIIKGTLTALSPMALSSNPVTLQGGTLGLGANVTAGAPIVTSGNFGSFALRQSVGTGGSSLPSVSGNTLTLTTNAFTSTANSAFYPTKVPVSDTLGFTATFTYNVTAGYADGIAFVLQNDPRGVNAISSSDGSDLGFGGTNKITNSAAVEFEIYPFGSHGTAFGANGLIPGDTGNPTTQYTSISPVNIATAPAGGGNFVFDYQPVDVTLVYNGLAQTLTETLFGETEKTSFTTTFTGVDYAALVGGTAGGSTTAFLGFTAATGGIASTQLISNFSYATNVSSPQSIGNAIVASSGTSAIQLGISAGSTATGGTVGAITINSGAIVNVTIPSAGANRGVLFTPSVLIATGIGGAFSGKLDLGSNDLVVTGSTLAQVTAMVASGYNGGKWDGQGIASSAVGLNHATALGVIVNDNGMGAPLYGPGGAISSTFDGSLPADGNVLVKYTYYGDANLDGAVDATDYSLIDNAYSVDQTYLVQNPGGTALPLTGWLNGDFNYDGMINGDDYTLIDNAFNTQGASLGSNPASVIVTATAQIAGADAVPEPTTFCILGVAAVGVLGARRRRI
jgi:autotransporter-associated beta strand protein